MKVYEKNAHSGGRLSLIHSNGHRFDQGPLVKCSIQLIIFSYDLKSTRCFFFTRSLYLMPKLFQETFSDLGENVSDHLDLLKCKRNYSVFFGDGDRCELSSDVAHLYKEIQRYEGKDEKTLLNFLDYLKETHVHYERSIEIALKNNYEHWYNEFQLKHVPNVFRLHLWNSVYGSVKKFFNSDKMRQAFSFQTMYIG